MIYPNYSTILKDNKKARNQHLWNIFAIPSLFIYFFSIFKMIFFNFIHNLFNLIFKIAKKLGHVLPYDSIHPSFLISIELNYALLAEPNHSIRCSTNSVTALVPGANNLRGSKPFPSRSFPSSIYLRVAAANTS